MGKRKDIELGGETTWADRNGWGGGGRVRLGETRQRECSKAGERRGDWRERPSPHCCYWGRRHRDSAPGPPMRTETNLLRPLHPGCSSPLLPRCPPDAPALHLEDAFSSRGKGHPRPSGLKFRHPESSPGPALRLQCPAQPGEKSRGLRSALHFRHRPGQCGGSTLQNE